MQKQDQIPGMQLLKIVEHFGKFDLNIHRAKQKELLSLLSFLGRLLDSFTSRSLMRRFLLATSAFAGAPCEPIDTT